MSYEEGSIYKPHISLGRDTPVAQTRVQRYIAPVVVVLDVSAVDKGTTGGAHTLWQLMTGTSRKKSPDRAG